MSAERGGAMREGPLLEARGLSRRYEVRRSWFAPPAQVRALVDVSFTLESGRTLAVVGESGCGKSTLARLVTMIEKPSAGALLIDGADVAGADAATRRRLRREVQIVFQDPYGSLNPRQTIGAALEEPLLVNTPAAAAERRVAALDMMRRVGLRPEAHGRYPHMFSGGQRQRIAIARALMLKPRVLVLDEPVSALDVSIRAQVLNLLIELQQEFGLAYLFVSHDLALVRHIADEVLVVYLGHVVESGRCDQVFNASRHPYTRALLSATLTAAPGAKRRRIILKGEPPSPFDPPSGCVFHPRCPLATARCASGVPPPEGDVAHVVACFEAARAQDLQ